MKTATAGGPHFYNQVTGQRVDLTAAQVEQPIAYDDVPAKRAEASAGATETQYRALRDAVVALVLQG